MVRPQCAMRTQNVALLVYSIVLLFSITLGKHRASFIPVTRAHARIHLTPFLASQPGQIPGRLHMEFFETGQDMKFVHYRVSSDWITASLEKRS
jgi:hypothetical protein